MVIFFKIFVGIIHLNEKISIYISVLFILSQFTIGRISIEYDGFERDLMLLQHKRKFQLGGVFHYSRYYPFVMTTFSGHYQI